MWTWDEPGDSTVSYTYRLWKTTSGSWTDWAEILETTLRAGEGVTIEWMLTGLPTDVAHTYISVRARNKNGFSPEARARVGPLEVTTLYFPDYVDGGGWSVQLALSHIAAATEDAEIIVTAYDQEGQPIPGFFDSEGTFGIPSLGTQILRSTGAGGDSARLDRGPDRYGIGEWIADLQKRQNGVRGQRRTGRAGKSLRPVR